MISVYIAAPFSEQEEAKKLRDALAEHGIGCTSRWLHEETSLGKNPPLEKKILFSRMDRYDVRRAQAVVVWNPEHYRDRGTGGRHVETGMGLMLSEFPVFLVGVESNIFHFLPEVVFQIKPSDPDPKSGCWVEILAEAIKDRCQDFGPTWDSPREIKTRG